MKNATHATPTQHRPADMGLVALIALLSAFIPLSTDLYLPALPSMAGALHASASQVNLTLMSFFALYSVGTLFWGPMSDRYGRRPILRIGLGLYILASILCACAGNVYQLIAFRILQAIGSGAATAVASAMVKDRYAGRTRETVLAMVQSMMMIAPIVAPVLGALLLKITSWRGVFWTLASIGVAALLCSLPQPETLEKRSTGTLLQTMGRLGVVVRNPGFTWLLATFSLLALPFFAFLAASSFIYIKEFGLSPQAYSYFFAGNALLSLLSPFIYLQLSKHINSKAIITTGFAVVVLSGVLLATLGHLHPWAFALCLAPASLLTGIIRTPSAHLMLEQQQEDIGSAVALMSCSTLFIGSLGMLLISLQHHTMILPLGLLHIIFGLLCGGMWLWVSRQPFLKTVHGFASVSGKHEREEALPVQ